jgi:hypothetical protein
MPHLLHTVRCPKAGINTRMGHIQHDTNSDRKGRVGDGSANTLKLRENYLA